MFSSSDHSMLPASLVTMGCRSPSGARAGSWPWASQICGMVPGLAVAENRRMGAPAPLDVYRQFQSFLINGEYSRLAEVADMDGYTEHCVGLTDWTTGLQMAMRNLQHKFASRL